MRRARASKTRGAERGSLLRFILVVALIAWAFRSFVAAPFNIPTGSMLPSVYIGDYLVVSKWPYGYSRFSFPFRIPSFDGRIFAGVPERGDVVVFAAPGGEGDDLVKRVVGRPGDLVEVRDGRPILNGRPLDRERTDPVTVPLSANSPCRVVRGARPVIRGSGSEAACVYPAFRETLPNGVSYTVLDQVDNAISDSFPATRVPPGHLFLMGDNRDDSLDSRFSAAEGGIGFVPVDHVIGRAETTFWSTDGSASYVAPWTWFSALRTSRIGGGFSETP